MDAREFLEQYQRLKLRADAKARKVSSLREALSIASPATDAEFVSHTKNVTRMADKIAAIVDTQDELDALIEKMMTVQKEIIDLLNQLEDPNEDLYLTERYLSLYSNVAIAKKRNVSTRWVRQIISSGIGHVQKMLDQKNFEKS